MTKENDHGERFVVRKDKNLLAQAKKVFGKELVVAAYVCKMLYSWTTEEEAKELLKQAAYKDGNLSKSGQLDFDNGDIRLEFCNGVTVHFSCSEWAEMHHVTDEAKEL